MHGHVERHILHMCKYTVHVAVVRWWEGRGEIGEIGVLSAAKEGETETPVCKTRFAGTQSVGICRITVFVRSVGGGGGGRGGRVEIKGKFYYRW